jgi:hypothetical protein
MWLLSLFLIDLRQHGGKRKRPGRIAAHHGDMLRGPIYLTIWRKRTVLLFLPWLVLLFLIVFHFALLPYTCPDNQSNSLLVTA